MYYRLLSLALVLLAIVACDNETPEIGLEVNGRANLITEFGDRLSNHEGIQIDFELTDEVVSTTSDATGEFSATISSWEDVKSISYSKDGFTSKKIIDIPSNPDFYIVDLIQLSTIEIYNLEAEALDQDGPIYQLSFEAENFFTNDLDQTRFFNLLVYNNQGNFINSMRFRAFQGEDDWGSVDSVEKISSTRARITYSYFRIWFLREYSSNVDLEFRVHGATSSKTYEHIFSKDGEIDNSLNDTFSSTLVRTK